ncbi:uncharacterized protein LAJ45_09949 [Morchella importuna]|uniref:uncharacterized protein n=1 Tax=Morchella importuna TaxID=1174673 RepID=UPI001E8D3D4E|nr:uncharacterized protein LAJ45_09949 [Morchella importuna]KAH8146027.1 hypothetical protein LAJ45_09949 [Morchella importuna]
MTVSPLPKDLQKKVNDVLDSLTLLEQVSLLAGKDFWRTVEIPGKVPSIKVTDGPSGARGQFFSGGTKAAFFPSGVSLAATFDPELITHIGNALGQETKTKAAQVLLAPTACNHRSPLGGRNFESFSEDPYLSGKLAASYISGVQAEGVAVTMKHFVANEQETKRFSVNEIIDERALREIYLKPFEIAVREAGPWGIMSSYNKVNAHHADLHPFSMKQVLRAEWGWDGLVMSDWGGTNSTAESLIAGLDLEMPGPTRRRGELLLKAVQDTNSSPELLAAIKTGARHVLELIARTGRWGKFQEAEEQAVDKLEHRELIRKTGAHGIVLLKNEGATLPIKREQIKSVAWIGPNANETIAGGGGSANLNPHYLTNPLESFTAAVEENDIKVAYEIGCQTEKWVRVFPVEEGRARTAPSATEGAPGLKVDFFGGRECSGECVASNVMTTSNIFLMDGKPPVLGDQDYSVRITTYIRPEATGEHVVGVGSIGPTKIYVDDKLLIDHTHWIELGELFFTSGSEEVTQKIHLEAGKWYKLVAETTSKSPEQKLPDMGNDNLDFASAIGIRLGIDAVRDVQEYIDRAAALAKKSDVAVVVVGMNNEWESEGYDRHTMALPGKQNELIEAVVKANPNTIVVNQSGCPVTMPWLDRVPAVLQAWYQGQEAGNALVDVLLGKVNPSGRLPITFPKRLEDNPSFGNFGDGGEKNQIAYTEGIYVGYRHYNSRDIPVLFPFGFGLSYTSFELGAPTVDQAAFEIGKKITVQVPVKNTGAIKGIETVQVYLAPKKSAVDRPKRELKGFAKIELEAGESGVARIELDHYAPGLFCEERKCWRALEGAYVVEVGRNVQEIDGSVEVAVEREYEWVF